MPSGRRTLQQYQANHGHVEKNGELQPQGQIRTNSVDERKMKRAESRLRESHGCLDARQVRGGARLREDSIPTARS